MSAREQFKKIQKQSIVLVLLGLLVAAFGAKNYFEAEKGIMMLDEGKLDETVLE